MWGFVKLVLFLVLVVLLVTHWDVVVAFFNCMVDWVAYWMKIASTGPPEIPAP